MTDRYKNEPFNTSEQKIIELALCHKNALNRIKELEAKIIELRKYARHCLSCACLMTSCSCDCGFSKLISEMRAKE